MLKKLIMLAILSAPVVTSAQGGVGRVTGRVVEGKCKTPLAHASVIIPGTAYEATTDGDGAFAIDSIGPGKYKVRAMMSGYAWGNASVTVGADAAADVTLTLKVRSGGLAAPARPAGTKKCAVHGVDMHAVAVRIGSGDMKPPEYTAEMASFPNAEPFEGDGKRIGVPLLGVTWGYRCPQCVQARNEHDNGGAWPLGFDGATPAGWARYTVANAVTFAAPAGLSASSTGTDCAGTSEWVGAGIRVTATYGPISYVDQFGSGDMGGDVIVDRMVVRVALWHTDGGGARLASGFWAPPTGDSRLTLVIDADGSAGLDTATGIVGSVRFVAK